MRKPFHWLSMIILLTLAISSRAAPAPARAPAADRLVVVEGFMRYG